MKIYLPDFAKRGGYIPVIVQDSETKENLMLGYANEEAFLETVKTRSVVLWSTSRNELWRKGLTSGDTMEVVQMRIDCDGDALIYLVRPKGPACHAGARTCFYRDIQVGVAELDAPKAGSKEVLQITDI